METLILAEYKKGLQTARGRETLILAEHKKGLQTAQGKENLILVEYKKGLQGARVRETLIQRKASRQPEVRRLRLNNQPHTRKGAFILGGCGAVV
jgi:hypothetical protein